MTGGRTCLVGLGVLLAMCVDAHAALGQPRKAVREAHSETPHIGLRYVPEQARILTPVPVFVTVNGVRDPKVWLHYKPFASRRFIRLVMDPREAYDTSVSPSRVPARSRYGLRELRHSRASGSSVGACFGALARGGRRSPSATTRAAAASGGPHRRAAGGPRRGVLPQEGGCRSVARTGSAMVNFIPLLAVRLVA